MRAPCRLLPRRLVRSSNRDSQVNRLIQTGDHGLYQLSIIYIVVA
jgi:hypothetical protein